MFLGFQVTLLRTVRSILVERRPRGALQVPKGPPQDGLLRKFRITKRRTEKSSGQ